MDSTSKLFPLLAGLPLFLGGIGCLLSGFAAQPLARMLGSTAAARRALGCGGCLGACSLIVLSTFIGDPIFAVVALALASFSNDLVMPGAWGACMDVGGKYAGTLSGAMNMMGNLGGAVASTAAPYILIATGNDWNVVLYVAAAVYFTGTFFWLAVDPVTPLERADAHA